MRSWERVIVPARLRRPRVNSPLPIVALQEFKTAPVALLFPFQTHILS